ncbi:MAG: 16S rRNA (uracil(1498)-N(3))-methyltransferase [Proteobacteria bacterium]|nr:16S rRNA (uracil(1498)-N(3))-methyltransferase [Pseudomonadota bacterium]
MKIRLYTPPPLPPLLMQKNDVLLLLKEQAHYVANVLRQKVGDVIFFFNGKDGEWKGVIRNIAKSGLEVEFVEQTRIYKPLKELHLIFSPIKQDRLSYMIEKATELGVTHLKPIITEYTQMRKINEERLIKIAIEASEQSERLCIPQILKEETLNDFLKGFAFQKQEIAFCNESLAVDLPFYNGVLPKQLKGVMIGPEGGFSNTERDMLSKVCFNMSLGAQILRAETAAIVALDRVRQL